MINELHVYYQNTQGLRTKTNRFYNNLVSNDYDIICLTETWLNSTVLTSELFSSKYNVYRRDRETATSTKKEGGGSLIAVKSIYQSSRCVELESEAEDVWICVGTGDSRVFVCCVYIPPNCDYSVSAFVNNLYSNEIVIQENVALLVGDFNLNTVSWQISSELFLEPFQTGNKFSEILDAISYFGLMQFNNVYNSNNKILDLILSNKNNSILNVNQSLHYLVQENHHHRALDFLWNISLTKCLSHSNMQIYNFNKANYDNVNHQLSQVNWEESLLNNEMNAMVEIFYNIINTTIQQFVPVRKIKGRFPVFFGFETIKIIKQKNKFHKRYKRYKDQSSYIRFCELRTLSKRMIKSDYLNFINNTESEILRNSKQFWKFIASKKRGHDAIPHSIKYNNKTANGGKEVSDLFAEFFSSVYIKDHSTRHGHFSVNKCTKTIEPIVNNTILQIINELDLKKCPGPDGIPPVFIKKCRDCLVQPLSIIYNASLYQGIFPNRWKVAEISPIFKGGQNNDVNNYRPISKLCIFGKILEKVVFDRVLSTVKSSIMEEQHGFFPNRSLETNLMCFSNYVSGHMDARFQVDTVYTDFSKAFDKINHNRMLERLAEVGVDSAILRFWVGRSHTYQIERTWFLCWVISRARLK